MSLKDEFMAEVFNDSLARVNKAAQDKINAALARAEKAEADLVQHRTWHNENMIQIARDGETIKKLEGELAKAHKLLAWCHRCNVLMNLVYPEDGSYRCPQCATRATPVPIREACEFEEEIETLKSRLSVVASECERLVSECGCPHGQFCESFGCSTLRRIRECALGLTQEEE